ncbi:hypothetical protein EVJ58_g2075 [Rhodofomes roseus]|uniref:Uncharacterized protein n=1 Tax=Rhodofomes roseus TaxID=34475 RepID=A0A4Y9YUC3_9APHY|nr:hypothetical protein EVJ58_g2075 [Rhodofomes roseus]
MTSVSSRSSSTSSTDHPVPAKPTWLPEITSAAELVHLGTLYLSFFLYTHCPARWLPEKVLSETLTIPRHLHPQDTAIRAWLYGWACYVEQHRRAPEEVAADSWHWAMELMFWPGRPLTGKNAVEFAWNRRVIPQQPGWSPDGSLKIGDVRRKWGMETMVFVEWNPHRYCLWPSIDGETISPIAVRHLLSTREEWPYFRVIERISDERRAIRTHRAALLAPATAPLHMRLHLRAQHAARRIAQAWFAFRRRIRACSRSSFAFVAAPFAREPYAGLTSLSASA